MIQRTLFGLSVGLALLLAACGSDGAESALDSGPEAATTSTSAAISETAAPSGTPGSSSAAAASPTPAGGPGGGGGAGSAQRKLGSSSGVATTANDPSFTALAGSKAAFGQIDRAAYQIEMPDAWNGELVLYAHGFAGFGTEVAVQTPPAALRRYMIGNGFAWAASSYGENGYVPGVGADDTLALKDVFVQKYGDPKRTYAARRWAATSSHFASRKSRGRVRRRASRSAGP